MRDRELVLPWQQGVTQNTRIKGIIDGKIVKFGSEINGINWKVELEMMADFQNIS